MDILYHGTEEQLEGDVNYPESDEHIEFKGSKLSNADYEADVETVTLYTEGSRFYVVLNKEDVAEIVRLMLGVNVYLMGEDQPLGSSVFVPFDELQPFPLLAEAKNVRVFVEPISG